MEYLVDIIISVVTIMISLFMIKKYVEYGTSWMHDSAALLFLIAFIPLVNVVLLSFLILPETLHGYLRKKGWIVNELL